MSECRLDFFDVMEECRGEHFRILYDAVIREAFDQNESLVEQESNLSVRLFTFSQNDVKSFEKRRSERSKEGIVILE